MKYDPAIHRRRSIRLQGYDYSQAGVYFITICTERRHCLFGDITDEKINLNAAGEMVCRWYQELEQKFPGIECDEYICMPNHLHFIVVNAETDVRCLVQWFKTMSTNEYIRGVKQYAWPPFVGKLWQRNYWEHIIRNEIELTRIREYIRNNPKKWPSIQ